ncbi:MAG: HAD-IIA family hydrolase [Anaerolineae bacterium]
MRPAGIIFDLDGTVYLSDHLIPGAAETIQWLRQRGHPLLFVSNKPLQSRADYAAKLTRLGIPTPPDQVINSSLVLVRYLSREMPGVVVYAIGEPPLLQELTDAGFRLSENPEEIDVVVASFDRTFEYRKLNIAFQALRRGARFFATNADATCPVAGGEIPDAGAVIGALEGCSKRKLELVVGKPSPIIIEVALDHLSREPGECFMVGDRAETDILMGHQAGMTTILVLSGVTRREHLAQAPVQPDHILESIAQIRGLFDAS